MALVDPPEQEMMDAQRLRTFFYTMRSVCKPAARVEILQIWLPIVHTI